MRILLAGGTGTLGRHVTPALADAGHGVIAVSRSETSDTWLRDIGAEPVRLDLFDSAAVRAAAAGIDAVVNLATSIPPGSRAMLPGAWKANDRLRSEASSNLADAAIAARARFVQESFAPTYADGGDAWIDESHSLDPVWQTRTVRDAEAAAARVADEGLPAVVLRFGLFYGAQAPSTVEMLDAARKGRLLLPGPTTRFTSMILVEDAARAVVAALDAPTGTYNVVEDDPATIRTLAVVLAEVLGVPEVKPLPAAMGRLGPLRAISRSHRMSNRAFRDATGWRPIATDAATGWRRVLGDVRVG